MDRLVARYRGFCARLVWSRLSAALQNILLRVGATLLQALLFRKSPQFRLRRAARPARNWPYRMLSWGGVALPADFADDRMRFAEAAPPGFKASLLHDLERGNRIELDWLSGKVVEFGRALGVPTPANEAAYAVLKLQRSGRNSVPAPAH